MGIKRQCEALVPYVRTMILLPVILLQGSFSKSIKAILPQYNLELQHDCPGFTESRIQAPSSIDCAAKMIDDQYDAFRYDAHLGICDLLGIVYIISGHVGNSYHRRANR